MDDRHDTQTDTTPIDYRAFEVSQYRSDDGIEILLTHPALEYDLSFKTGEEWCCDPQLGEFAVDLFRGDEALDHAILEDEVAVNTASAEAEAEAKEARR